MSDNWTDAERLAAEVLTSGSEEALQELLVELDKRSSAPRRPGQASRTRPRSRTGSGAGPRFRGSRTRRFAARVASNWRRWEWLDVATDGIVVLVALACIGLGSWPLVTPISDARPAISEAIAEISIPAAADAGPAGLVDVTAAERRVSAGEPITLMARNLEASIGRYRSVADMYASNRLPCSGLRQSYEEVESGWTRYSIARGRITRNRSVARLARWDEALYEAVREVDRDFTGSGCSRP